MAITQKLNVVKMGTRSRNETADQFKRGTPEFNGTKAYVRIDCTRCCKCCMPVYSAPWCVEALFCGLRSNSIDGHLKKQKAFWHLEKGGAHVSVICQWYTFWKHFFFLEILSAGGSTHIRVECWSKVELLLKGPSSLSMESNRTPNRLI